ncbi:MAG: S9 family peptidase [Bacteroidetes bacterium]|nr:MAG: S9 family peptidase [Bacteroidota bacterium]
MTQCTQERPLQYPETRMDDIADTYFGIEVADPYRWLEDDNSAETKAWVTAQNEVTFGYLENIPFRSKINDRLTDLWNYERYSTPWKKGDYYFYYKNDGMQNQSVLYVREGLEGESRVLLDPNAMSEEGIISIGRLGISNDSKYLAYSTSKGGSDWNEIFVLEIATGKILEDHIRWVKFSNIAWKGEGFYYSRYDEPASGEELSAANEFHKVYYHKLGTSQEHDRLVYWNPNHPRRNYGVATTDDERFVILSESQSTMGNALYVKDNTKPGADFVKIIDGFEYSNNVIDHIDGKLLVMTNHSAPMNRVVLIDPARPAPSDWKEIIPESGNVLRGSSLIGGKIISTYLQDAHSKAYIHAMDGTKEAEVELPALGSLGGFSGNKDENTAFFSFSSFNFPSTVFKFDVNTNSYEEYFAPELDFTPEDYEIRQVFYSSKDGTQVPMFIVHKKGLKLNGQNPTLLYGYGGFDVSLTPGFSLSRLILLENGGVYVMANLRGGGEYGKAWHDAGRQLNRQNVFDDFIAAAEYLIEEGYTSPEKLAIQGGSNGGLLVGAAMAQRPELFKVAFPAVGVLDMLRYHLFTIGWAWADDYGTSEEEVHFHNLYSYSPLHNLEQGVNYPATLITTADHDDRVVPAHSFKFAAELQRRHEGNNPVLIRIDVDAGHGAGKPISKVIEEQTDIWSFMFYNMGVKPRY